MGWGPTRNPYTSPFDPASCWMTPIGSGATFVAAGLPTRRDSAVSAEKIPLCMDVTQPSTGIFQDNSQGTRNCTGNTGATVAALFNQALVVPSSGANLPCAFIGPDTQSRIEGGNFSHCTNGGQAAANSHLASFGSITDLGLTGGSGGSNISTLGGTIRANEFTLGTAGDGAAGLINFIRHALRFNLYGHTDLDAGGPPGNPNAGWRWPATHADGNFNTPGNNNFYGGTVADSVMGSLYALPQSSTTIIVNSGGAVTYGTVGGKGTLTDTSAAWGVNAFAGFTVVVGGNSFTVASNTAQTVTLTTGWGGTPTAGTQYCVNSLGLVTVPGCMIGWTLLYFGGYVCNNSSGSMGAAGFTWPIATEWSAITDVAGTEFPGLYGFNFVAHKTDGGWGQDCDAMIQALSVVKNNALANVGGGGTPSQPLAPSFNAGPPAPAAWRAFAYKH